MTDDLVTFLEARLDEDRRIAFEAGNGGPDDWTFDPELPWNSDAGPREAVVRSHGSALSFVAAVDPVHGKYGTWNARHIARHDPKRVLAEVDAKRRIIDAHRPNEYGECVICSPDSCGCAGGESDYPCTTLRLLALPHANHPDYQPEWAPNA